MGQSTRRDPSLAGFIAVGVAPLGSESKTALVSIAGAWDMEGLGFFECASHQIAEKGASRTFRCLRLWVWDFQETGKVFLGKDERVTLPSAKALGAQAVECVWVDAEAIGREFVLSSVLWTGWWETGWGDVGTFELTGGERAFSLCRPVFSPVSGVAGLRHMVREGDRVRWAVGAMELDGAKIVGGHVLQPSQWKEVS